MTNAPFYLRRRHRLTRIARDERVLQRRLRGPIRRRNRNVNRDPTTKRLMARQVQLIVIFPYPQDHLADTGEGRFEDVETGKPRVESGEG